VLGYFLKPVAKLASSVAGCASLMVIIVWLMLTLPMAQLQLAKVVLAVAMVGVLVETGLVLAASRRL